MKRRFRPALLAVVAIGCLLAICFGAELYNGAISNLLAPFYGSTQTRMDGVVGVPLGASVSVDGYTLTADAIIRANDTEAIVYTFTRDDGQSIPEKKSFARYGAGDLKIVRLEETPHQVKLVKTEQHDGIPLGRITTIAFSGLTVGDQLLADGPWELTFVQRYRNSSVQIPGNISVQGELGEEYVIQRIVFSPLSLQMDVTAPVPQSGLDLMDSFTVDLRRIDGTIHPVWMSLGAGWNDEDKTVLVELDEYFELPVFLDEVDALVVCGTDISLK